MEPRDSSPSAATITLWSWLFPLTYIIHIAEEYWGGEGYPAYILRLRGVHLEPGRFLLLQGVGLLLLVIGIVIARRFGFREMMLVILGATVLINGITHTATSISHGGYGPGLVSSLLIWIPLGVVTLIRFKRITTEHRYWIAVSIGVGINGIVTVLALSGGRIT